MACYERTNFAVGNSLSALGMRTFARAVFIESGAINVSNAGRSWFPRGRSLWLDSASYSRTALPFEFQLQDRFRSLDKRGAP